MTIQFGGLATGLDTTAIIEQLMELERLPIERLEAQKVAHDEKLAAFTELDTLLKSFAESIENINYRDTLEQRSTKLSSDEHLSATASRDALPGTSYQVEVVSLAQVQKSVAQTGVVSKTTSTFGTGELNLTVDGKSHTINITEDNNSLEGIMKAINEADIGVSAAIINDGSGSPYRLILTGEDVAKSFSMDTSGLTGGTSALGQFNVAGSDGAITNPPVQAATPAHIRVDGVNIYSTSNTLTEAIPGVSLDLLKGEIGTTTSITIDVDETAIKTTLEDFVKGYNEVMSFITSQSVVGGAGGGVLGGDANINSIKRSMQSLLTQPFENSGVFSTMSQLGFETQRDGTLVINDKVLSAAIDDNLDSVATLLAGEEGTEGLGTQFKDFLYDVTNSGTGMLKGREDSVNTSISRIDSQIASMETRLEQRQTTIEAQFSAMELLVSGFNAQSSYLTQQMDMLTDMMSGA